MVGLIRVFLTASIPVAHVLLYGLSRTPHSPDFLSRSSYSWRLSNLGRVVSLLNAQPHDYNSRLIHKLCGFVCDGPPEI